VTRGLRLALWALALAGLALYSARQLSFATDITNFMPDGAGSELARLSRELAHSDLARTMVLTIGAKDPERAVAGAQQLAAALRAHPEVAWLRAGADEELQRKLFELYFPRRHYFLSDAPERELPQQLSDAGLRARAEETRRALASPVAPLLKRILPEDPLGAFPAILARFQQSEPPLASRDGGFTTRDGRWAVLLLATKSSAFATRPQAELLGAIDSAFAEVRARHGKDLVLEMSGANRFALHAERSIQGDAIRIASLSFAGVSLIFLLFFRAARALVLVLVPALAGLVFAFAASTLAFGQLDGMTIAFGASLIGATVDYPLHVLNLANLSPPDRSTWAVARQLRKPLTLAALTTIASFVGLAFTAFAGFRQLGVFATAGILGALAATLFLMPDLLPKHSAPPALTRRLARRLALALAALRERKLLLAALPALGLALAPFALPRLTWMDDLSALGQPDLALHAEDQRVRARVSNFEGGRLVVALAETPEAAIALNERVDARLRGAIAAGHLDGVRSLHALLWSAPLQQRNLAALRAQPELAARLDAAYRAAGFRAGAFAPFAESLADPPPPLTLDELRASPLGELAQTLVVPLGARTGVITYLRGVHDIEALRASLSGLTGVTLFEQRSFLNTILASFRDQTLRQIAIGSGFVFLLLLVRYRDLRRSLAAFLPSLIAGVSVLSVFALTGHPVNLLHAIALLMVMGMGVDYGIYVVDGVDHEQDLGATVVSILLCALTTIFALGALAVSDHAGLRAIGLTTGLGILLSFLFAPSTLLLLREEPRDQPLDAARSA
jgi:predicted exporter